MYLQYELVVRTTREKFAVLRGSIKSAMDFKVDLCSGLQHQLYHDDGCVAWTKHVCKDGGATDIIIPPALHDLSVWKVVRNADEAVPHARFCLNCSKDLFAHLDEPSSDDAVIDLLVPTCCPACDRRYNRNVAPGLSSPVVCKQFHIPWELYSEYVLGGSYKIGNPRRNLHVNLTSSIEGDDIKLFNRKKEAILMVLPYVAQLQNFEVRRSHNTLLRTLAGVTSIFWGAGIGIAMSHGLVYGLSHWVVVAKPVASVIHFTITTADAIMGYDIGVRVFDDMAGTRVWIPGMEVCRFAGNWRRLATTPLPALPPAGEKFTAPPDGTEGRTGGLDLCPERIRMRLQEQSAFDNGGDIGVRVILGAEDVTTCTNLATINATVPDNPLIVSTTSSTPVVSRADRQMLADMPWSGTWGPYDTKIKFNGKCLQVGPLLGNAVCYENDDLLTAVAALPTRLIPSKLPDETSEVYKRLKQFMNVFKLRHITHANVKHAMHELGITENLGGKRGPDEVRKYLTELATKCDIQEAIDVITKLEVSSKSNKPPRLVFNEGAWRQVTALLVVSIFEKILFSPHLCGATSIKARQRSEFADNISKTLCSPPTNRDGSRREVVGIEVDQTRFDSNETGRTITSHNRQMRVGTILSELEILDFIVSMLPKTLFEERHAFDTIRSQEDSGQSKIKIRGKKTLTGEKDDALYKLTISWLYRTSGNRRTSSGNYLEEMGATLCVHTKNPWKLWEVADLRKFDFIFVGIDDLELYFRPFAEGDDFVGQGDRRVSEWSSQVIASYEQLGLEAKLVYVVGSRQDPKRLEFCGIHFLCVNGCTVRGAWIPDVVRTLIVSGASTATGDPAQKFTAIASAYYMRALGSARFRPASAYYERLGDQWAARLHEVKLSEAPIKGYDVQLLTGDESSSFASLKNLIFEAQQEKPLATDVMERLVSASVGGKVTRKEINAWESGAASVSIDTTADEVYSYLPRAVVTRLLASFA